MANDFKVEAQEDIEKLMAENVQLKEQINKMKSELDRLKLASEENRKKLQLGSSSNSNNNNVSPDVKSRMIGYLNSVETVSNGLISKPTGQKVKLTSHISGKHGFKAN